MPRRKARRSKPPMVSAESRTAQALKEFRSVQSYVPEIVAAGVLTYHDNDAIEIAESLALERGGDAVRKKIQRLADQLPGEADLSALCIDMAIRMTRYGYLLGVAVGQHLGPTAFQVVKDGAR